MATSTLRILVLDNISLPALPRFVSRTLWVGHGRLSGSKQGLAEYTSLSQSLESRCVACFFFVAFQTSDGNVGMLIDSAKLTGRSSFQPLSSLATRTLALRLPGLRFRVSNCVKANQALVRQRMWGTLQALFRTRVSHETQPTDLTFVTTKMFICHGERDQILAAV